VAPLPSGPRMLRFRRPRRSLDDPLDPARGCARPARGRILEARHRGLMRQRIGRSAREVCEWSHRRSHGHSHQRRERGSE
jgi:hypothetical protein